jgi:hypothetical protein
MTNFEGSTLPNITLKRRHPIYQVSIVKYIEKASWKIHNNGLQDENRKTYLDLRNVSHHLKYLTLLSGEVRRIVQ